MRLGQLARKLEIRPIDIVDFLAKRNINIEEGANTKVDDAHVVLVFQYFAPSVSVEEAMRTDIPTPIETVAVQNAQEAPVTPADSTVAEESSALETETELPEVIKAPKVALSGLKIVGKIDLPEPKQKQAEEPLESGVELDGQAPKETAVPKEVRKQKRSSSLNRTQRPASNPIALQREQQALESRAKREEEIQRQKEKRTQNYLKKIKGSQPTKAMKFVKEQTEQMSAAELAEPPKTLWGKFIKWLTT